ncbi:hypothetical protein CAL22_19015 [Bordetella genomosp. 12]|uniref:histidine kinase n=1 Tax=Bordetella genomosp. 12 TaxID=463035 RepID=A0A261VCY6_9BORD|nr:hypothetical protein CAL22_19015 [Bordetella genomosp. 12]
MLALWLVAMLAAHLIAVLMMSWWRMDNNTIHPMSARTIETRILSAYRIATRSPNDTRLLDDVSLPDSRFTLAGASRDDGSGMNAQEQALADTLRKTLALAPGSAVNVHLHHADAGMGGHDNRSWLEKMLKSTKIWALSVEVALPDGKWLRSEHMPTIMPAHWSRVLSFSLLVGMLPTALIALLFGRRIMRPLRKLTEASRRVSRGEHVILPPSNGLDSVRDITRAFNDMQENLLRFVQGRTRMIAAIGHDLRTPLTSLRIRAELVDDDALREAMVRTLDDMKVIVEGTLQFARDDAQQEATQEVPLQALISDVVAEQRLHGHQVEPRFLADSAALHYRCRPVHLKRALNNLIDNGARHGSVALTVSCDPARQKLRIDVADNGPGIPPDKLEQVFEPFVRLDQARSQTTGGAGLGLAIARSCCRAHGGDVTLQNRPEGGLSAVIELPI